MSIGLTGLAVAVFEAFFFMIENMESEALTFLVYLFFDPITASCCYLLQSEMVTLSPLIELSLTV